MLAFSLHKYLDVFCIPEFWGVLIFGVLNNVGVAQMAYEMPSFPSFLNYWVAFLSFPLFAAIGKLSGEPVFETLNIYWRRQHPGRAWQHHKQYLILGFITGVNWIAVQYVAAWVNGNLQQVVCGLNPVFVLLFSIPVTNLQVTRSELLGFFVVICGVMIASWPAIVKTLGIGGEDSEEVHPYWYDSWYFIFGFVVSVLAQSLGYVWQDRIFKLHNLHPATCCFWSQLYVIPMYTFAIPIEMLPQVTGTDSSNSLTYVMDNQIAAFRCFLGVPFESELRHGNESHFRCASKLAGLWVVLFVVGFVGMFYFMGVFTKKTTAFWTQVMAAIIGPVAAFVFSIKALVGEVGYAPFTIYSGFGFLVIFLGVCLRERATGQKQSSHDMGEALLAPDPRKLIGA
mmetsp:Transcript_28186/g.49115  ORF Transcript_28186/g.49115 Transcript_28186/m.49115 type:complete len:397 (-) Transcript_28186:92-1282(-)